jgi:hypothetical protein
MQKEATQPRSISPAFEVFKMVAGIWRTRPLHVAVELGLADLLKDEPKTVEQLARETQTHAPSLRRLLRALAAQGIFVEQANSIYAQSELSDYLRRDHPDSLHYMARMMASDWEWQSWRALPHSIHTGKPALEHVFHMTLWEYFAHHPEDAQVFNRSMTSFSKLFNPSIVAAYDFSQFQTLADIGGGHGNFLLSLLEQYPDLHCILYDHPAVIEEAKTVQAQTPLTQHCTFTAGDFFEEVPAGADAYFMKFILHDWDDEHCRTILSNCRTAMPAHGKLLVADHVLIPGASITGTTLDITMLVCTHGGLERTEEEFVALFASAGFKLSGIFPTATEMYLLEAVPIS